MEDRKKKLVVATVNVQGGLAAKLDDLLDLVQLVDADILCMQELQLGERDSDVQHQVAQMKRRAAAHHCSLFVRLAPATSSRHASVGLLVRWPWQTYITQLWSPDATGRSLWCKVSVGSLRLVVCSAYAQATRRTSQELRHFIKWHDLVRAEVQRLQAQRWSVIVGGDFNQRLDVADNKSAQLRALVRATALRDAFRVVSPSVSAAPGHTHDGWGGMTPGRIDYFLASAELQVLECAVDSSAIALSDHQPLVLRLQLEEAVHRGASVRRGAPTLRRPLTGTSELAVKKRDKFRMLLSSPQAAAPPPDAPAVLQRSALIAQLQGASRVAFGESRAAAGRTSAPPWRSDTRRAIVCRRALCRVRHALTLLAAQQQQQPSPAAAFPRVGDVQLLLKHCRSVAGVAEAARLIGVGELAHALDALHQQQTLQLLLDVERRFKARDTAAAVAAALEKINTIFRSGRVGDIVRKALMQRSSGAPSVVLVRDAESGEDSVLADPAAVQQQYHAHYAALATTTISCPCGDAARLFDDDRWHSAVSSDAGSQLLDPSWWDDVVSPFTHDEVQQAIRWARSGAAAGDDQLANEHFKAAPPSVVAALTAIFNAVLREEAFPSAMLHAIIVPIPKKEQDSRVPANTRGISLLPCDMRLMCAILARRMSAMFAKHRLLDEAQAGFLRGRGTQGSLLALRCALEDANQRSRPLCVSSLDVAKAYDSVEPWLLQAAMQRLRAPPALINLVSSMFRGAQAQVRTAHGLTAAFPVTRGTPQGNPMAPLLWNMCVDPLLCALRKQQAQHGYSMGPGGGAAFGRRVAGPSAAVVVGCLAYADDVRLLAKSPASLQAMLQTCADFCVLAGLRLNIAKCEWFATRCVPLSAAVSLQQQPLTRLNDKPMRVLGVHFTPALDFRQQHARLLQTVRMLGQLMQLRRLTAAQAAYVANAVLAAKIAFVLAITGATAAQLQQLQSALNRACLRACKLPRSHARLLVTLPMQHMGCGVMELGAFMDGVWLRMLDRQLRDADADAAVESTAACALRERFRALQDCWATPGNPLLERVLGSAHCKRGDRWLVGHLAAVLADNQLRYALHPASFAQRGDVGAHDSGAQLRLLLPARLLGGSRVLRAMWEQHGVCRLDALTKGRGERARLLQWREVTRKWCPRDSSRRPTWFAELERRVTDDPHQRHIRMDAADASMRESVFAGAGLVDAATLQPLQQDVAELLRERRVAAVLRLLASPQSPLKQHGAVFQQVARLGAAMRCELQPKLDKESTGSHEWSVLVRMATMQLPTRVWLARFAARAGPPPDERCRRCGADDETLLHIVWRCGSHAQRRALLLRIVHGALHSFAGLLSPQESNALHDALASPDRIPLFLPVVDVREGRRNEKVGRINVILKEVQHVLLAMWHAHITGESATSSE